jgi:ribonuclease HII
MESRGIDRHGSRLAGVDEAGRGPLAGPVVAAAVILDPEHPIVGLRDSKRLSARQRQSLADCIRQDALAWAVAHADVEEIDRLNILRATHLAMQRAVAALAFAPGRVLVDGHIAPEFGFEAIPVVKGDALVPAISAASILAKVERDQRMIGLGGRYPGYGFELHKGYPTRAHREALARLGPSPAHRMSFAPVRAAAARVAAAETGR